MKSPQRSRKWIVFVGAVLLLAGVIFGGASIYMAMSRHKEIDVLLPGPAFEAEPPISPDVSRPIFEAARKRMLEINGDGYWWQVTSKVAGWGSFLLSGLITLLAGTHGVIRPLSELTPDELEELKKHGSQKFSRRLAILAALAAILTGFNSKATDESAKDYARADQAHKTITEAVENFGTTKDPAKGQEILDNLKLEIGRL